MRGVYGRQVENHALDAGSSPRAWALWPSCCKSRPGCRFIPTCVGFISPVLPPRVWLAVHPHVRGVYWRESSNRRTRYGSSPRAWGLCSGADEQAAALRFIPTCVGFMFRCLRVWGQLLGSSPRAWGLWRRWHVQLLPSRFIPTCVGFMPYTSPKFQSITVHPHVRGVYLCTHTRRSRISGSSPRAWGLYSSSRGRVPGGRFIPTCVGFMIYSWRNAAIHAVHPHVRGVYVSSASNSATWYGSSPRAWGLYSYPIGVRWCLRFIPTCVGFMIFRKLSTASRIGSSPRAWGLSFPPSDWPASPRFIPTCVGFMDRRSLMAVKTSVHPHVRGVYFPEQRWSEYPAGSSPRAWGLFPAHSAAFAAWRFIPTCVGFMLFLRFSRAMPPRFIPTCVGFMIPPASCPYP